MKKPETICDLVALCHPDDLYEVLTFSGFNDQSKEYSFMNTKKEEIIKKIYPFTWRYKRHKKEEEDKYININDMRSLSQMKLDDEHHETIYRIIQDYYWWSNKLNGEDGYIYSRVINALDISIEELENLGRPYNHLKSNSYYNPPELIEQMIKDYQEKKKGEK